jgi:hypothetical protein
MLIRAEQFFKTKEMDERICRGNHANLLFCF